MCWLLTIFWGFFFAVGLRQGTLKSVFFQYGCERKAPSFLPSLFKIIKNHFGPSFHLWNYFIKIRQENILI